MNPQRLFFARKYKEVFLSLKIAPVILNLYAIITPTGNLYGQQARLHVAIHRLSFCWSAQDYSGLLPVFGEGFGGGAWGNLDRA